MPNIHIDLETRSGEDVRKVGVHRYCRHPDFEILLIGYKIDNEETRCIDVANGEDTREFQALLCDPNNKFFAFNAPFEIACLEEFFCFVPPLDQWQCVQVMALTAGVPGSLAQVGTRLGVQEVKETAGGRLISKFCSPPYQAPEGPEWEQFVRYCKQDVRAEYAIHNRLRRFEISGREHALWRMDQKINGRGVQIDTPLVEQALVALADEKKRLIQEMKDLTGLDNPNSQPQLLRWLKRRFPDVEDVTKGTVAELLTRSIHPRTRKVLELRQQLNKSSSAKWKAILNGVMTDGNIRDLLQFFGAARTGRWAGRRIQLQNLPRNYIEDLDEVRAFLKKGQLDTIRKRHPLMDVLSQLIRTAIVPTPGRVLGAVDFSAIEAVVLAWLSDCKWRLDVFRTDGKIYERSAAEMFGVPIDQIAPGEKHYELRQRGKVAELACGYGGGVNALITMGALENGLKESELDDIKHAWRDASPEIPAFWAELESCAKQAILAPREVFRVNKWITFQRRGRNLYMQLPVGRELCYPEVGMMQTEFGLAVSYMGPDTKTKVWQKLSTWGGKLCENATQAIARDCLTEAMIRVDDIVDLGCTVHDELIYEAEEGHDVREVIDRVTAPIGWAPGLPLRAHGELLPFYQKA